MSYLSEPCDRCGSKRIISKSHTEVIETFLGPQKIEVSEIRCTNKVCQKAYEISNEEIKKESEARKAKKEERDIIRKNNIRLTRKKTATN